jgi:hypothetical protein
MFRPQLHYGLLGVLSSLEAVVGRAGGQHSSGTSHGFVRLHALLDLFMGRVVYTWQSAAVDMGFRQVSAGELFANW